jgi:hypothetical protein
LLEVVTVRVDGPEALATEEGLNEHAGGSIVAGEPLSVTLQEKVTFAPKPPVGETVIVALADPPAVTVAGESVVVEITKPGRACTTSDRGAVCVSQTFQ